MLRILALLSFSKHDIYTYNRNIRNNIIEIRIIIYSLIIKTKINYYLHENGC